MKPFVINRKSWHYKMNMNMHDRSTFGWELDHSDFCSYWRKTILNILQILFVLTFVCAIFAVIVIGFWQAPVESSIMVGAIIGVFASVIGVVALFSYLSNKPKSESLIAQKYRAHKSKICPMVEFDD